MDHNISELLTLLSVDGSKRNKYTTLLQRDILLKLVDFHKPIDTNIKTIAHELITSSHNFTFNFTLKRIVPDGWRRDIAEYKKQFDICPICKENTNICGTLEAHEIFSYNYQLGVMQVDDIKVMCKYCHLLHHNSFLTLCKSTGLFVNFDANTHLKKICMVNKIKVFTIEDLHNKTIDLYVKNANTIRENFELGNYKYSYDAWSRQFMYREGWKIAMLPEYNGYAFTEVKKSLVRKGVLYFEETPADIDTLVPVVVPKKEKPQKIKVHRPKKKIRCITTGKVFDTNLEALAFYSLSKNTINRYFSGVASHGGYLNGISLEWEYIYSTEDDEIRA